MMILVLLLNRHSQGLYRDLLLKSHSRRSLYLSRHPTYPSNHTTYTFAWTRSPFMQTDFSTSTGICLGSMRTIPSASPSAALLSVSCIKASFSPLSDSSYRRPRHVPGTESGVGHVALLFCVPSPSSLPTTFAFYNNAPSTYLNCSVLSSFTCSTPNVW